MLFGRKSPKVILDANALRDFFRVRKVDSDVRDRALARFVELTDAGLLRSIATQPILWELGSIIGATEDGGWAAYERVVRFYLAQSKLLTLHEYERKASELRMKVPLLDRQVFYRLDPDKLLRDALSRDWVERKRRELESQKLDEREKEVQKRLEALEALKEKNGANWRQQLVDMFANDWERTIRFGVNTEMRAFARERRIDVRPPWPDPKAARTFWFSESAYFAKAKRVFVDNERKELTSKTSLKDIPDMVDMTHLRDAAYVDVMVTSDQRLCEVGRAAKLPLHVITFPEFASALTS